MTWHISLLQLLGARGRRGEGGGSGEGGETPVVHGEVKLSFRQQRHQKLLASCREYH